MTDELPNPLTPADCDLRDFGYMPVDVVRVCDSDLAALESPEACWTAFILWCKSWHQLPAGSLPDDERVLRKLTGYQHAPERWESIRDGAMRGWIKCSDGRLYHRVVAEKVVEAWHTKHRMAHEKLIDRVRKRNKQRAEKGQLPLEVPALEQWIDMGRPMERELFPSEFGPPSTGIPPKIPPENALTGANRNGAERKPVNTSGSNDGGGTPTRAREIDGLLTAVGISTTLIEWERDRGKAARNMTPSQQQVIDLAALSVTPDELRKAYELAVADRIATNDPAAVNAGFVRAKLEQVRRPPPPKREDHAWKRSPAGIERKASELGLVCPPGRDHAWLLEKCESELRKRAQSQGVAA
jgi:hypothetical protein